LNVGGDSFRKAITYELTSIKEGPIDIYLGDRRLQIVDPERDLPASINDSLNPNIRCFIVDPNAKVDVDAEKGYKPLRDGERVILGRRSYQERFDFDPYVSSKHVQIRRTGDELEIIDLSSANHTYLGRTAISAVKQLSADIDTLTPELNGDLTFEVAAHSVANERHPDRNEDAYFINENLRAIGVFDGVGGASGSDEASRLAAHAIPKALETVHNQSVPLPLARLAVRDVLIEAHETIMRKGEGQDIATTATIAKVFQTEKGTPYVVIGSAGDSRAYLYRDDMLSHLTLDHAYLGGATPEQQQQLQLQQTLAEVVDLTNLNEKELAAFQSRQYITSCLGGDGTSPTITVTEFEIAPGDRLLLTTDGVHDNLTNSEVTKVLRDIPDNEFAAEVLVKTARSRSLDDSHVRAKRDDMTAAILAYPA